MTTNTDDIFCDLFFAFIVVNVGMDIFLGIQNVDHIFNVSLLAHSLDQKMCWVGYMPKKKKKKILSNLEHVTYRCSVSHMKVSRLLAGFYLAKAKAKLPTSGPVGCTVVCSPGEIGCAAHFMFLCGIFMALHL